MFFPRLRRHAKWMFLFLALAFGLDHIVVDRARPLDAQASLYLSNTAVTRGKPALTIESGGMARTDEESIARIERGIAGLMRHLKMRATGPEPVAHPIWIERGEVLTSDEERQKLAAGHA